MAGDEAGGFPDALRHAISRRGLTQAAAARALGVSPQYVSEFLAGRRNPSGRLQPKVARFLGISRDELRALFVKESLEQTTAALAERVRVLEQIVLRQQAELDELRGPPLHPPTAAPPEDDEEDGPASRPPADRRGNQRYLATGGWPHR